MSRRSDNDSRDRTRNERKYIVQYHYPWTGTRVWEFHTRDKRQAYSKAGQYAELGWFVGLKRHNGVGRWEELQIPEVTS